MLLGFLLRSKLVPLSYNVRSLLVRKSATLLTILGIGATVAIVAGTIALQQGFSQMFTGGGRADVAVFLRPGATNEGDSQFSRERGMKLIKGVQEIEVGPNGPLASMEAYLAVLLEPARGGMTNVPVRGVQPATFEIRKEELRVVDGRNFTPGSDELVIGSRLVGRISNSQIGDVITFNKTPFKIVGTFEHPGQFGGEIWGDLDRLLAAMGRYGPNRVIAKLKPGVVLGSVPPEEVVMSDEPKEPEPGTLAARLLKDTEVPARSYTEEQYLASQTFMLSVMLLGIGFALAVVMGLAAVFTAMNTMLASVASRTREIGILLAVGYRPFPIFLSFLFESLLLGLIGGIVGCLLALPFNGVSAGMMNFQTFTEMAFAFRVGPGVLVLAVVFSVVLGLVGGAWPALRASLMRPTAALRRE